MSPPPTTMAPPTHKKPKARTTFLSLPLEIRQNILLASDEHLKIPDYDHAKAAKLPYPSRLSAMDQWTSKKLVRLKYIELKDEELRRYKAEVIKWVNSLKGIKEIRGDVRWVRKMWKKKVRSVGKERGLVIWP
ncbi:hypothetical protein FKW77_001929 [Venturia effusa]|uniref:Uncharacterized protein n=1 Tax=Venturia effusa TaxID=50376 RepID=A0A517L2S8_9PEZI|nr:hypothetical protein FKW77_001929 [Venturia effusa]